MIRKICNVAPLVCGLALFLPTLLGAGLVRGAIMAGALFFVLGPRP